MADSFGKKRLAALSIALISLAGLAAYAPTLNNPLICDDYYLLGIDRLHLAGYEHLGNLSTLKWIFYAEWPVQLRPIPLASFRFVSFFFGLTDWPYHLLAVLLHIGCALLLYLLISSLGISRLAATLAGLLFVLTPIAPETVTWPAGIIDSWALLFMLAALWLYVRFLRSGNRWEYTGSLAAVAGALLSKEVAIPMVALLPAADLLLAGPLAAAARERRPAEDAGAAAETNSDSPAPSPLTGFFSSRLRRVLPFLALLALYVLVRYLILGVIAGANAQVLSSAGRELSLDGLQATWVKLIAPLNAFHVEPWVRWLFYSFQSLLLAAALVVIIYRRQRASSVTNRTTLLLVLLFCLPLIPIASTLAVGVKDDLQWSHFLYIPMAALLSLLAIALCGYGRPSRLRLAVGVPVLGLMALFFAWGLFQNNQMWEDATLTEALILNQVVALVPDPPPGARIYIAEDTERAGRRLYWCIPMLQPATRALYSRFDLEVKQIASDQTGKTQDGYLLLIDGNSRTVRLDHVPAPASAS